MPRMIAKFGDDAYGEWSTVVDAPVTPIFDRVTAVSVFGPDRIERADAFVTSHFEFQITDIQQLIAGNRAGDGETELDLAGILEEYRDPEYLDRVKGSNRLIAVSDLVFIRDPGQAGPYLLKSRTTPAGFVTSAELASLIDENETVLELRRNTAAGGKTDWQIVKDERGLLADVAK